MHIEKREIHIRTVSGDKQHFKSEIFMQYIVEPKPDPVGAGTICLSGTITRMHSGSGFESEAEIKSRKSQKYKYEIPTFWATMPLLTLKRQDFYKKHFKNC